MNFIVGAIIGGVIVWFTKDSLEFKYLELKTKFKK